MKRALFSLLVGLLVCYTATAQQKKTGTVDNFAELTAGIGSSQATGVLAYTYNWKVGKRKKWELGLGARFTSYFGSNLYFKTAPAKLTSGKTDPTVLFSSDIEENIDSVLFPKAQVNSLNLSLNFGYNFSKKFSAGLTIDAVGFSFGKKQSGIYYGNNFATGVPVNAKPTGFNLLLISDNDRGSLNSELFARYKWNDSWGVKLGLQFYFAEYTTDTKVQTTPGGDTNDRFRKKMAGVGIGVTYNFKK
jgi:long-subunit fatty acid transport protein